MVRNGLNLVKQDMLNIHKLQHIPKKQVKKFSSNILYP